MTHLWIRAEQRANERRTGITPQGTASLRAKGVRVTIEDSPTRIIPTADYAAAGCEIADFGSWPEAPEEAIIFGLKELPEAETPLRHRHIMFGHAFKGQQTGQKLLARFRQGGGTLYDLEYLVDDQGRRVAAFGYWAGFAGAAVSLRAWLARQAGGICGPVGVSECKDELLAALREEMKTTQAPPTAIIIGALGRVGTGAGDLLTAMGVPVTRWDMAETAQGGPFPEILTHDLFINCILARPGTPVFVPPAALEAPHRLGVIGDVACDPDSDYNPVPLYDQATSWASPVLRTGRTYPFDIMAIDNLPSLLPLESSHDFASQLLPHLETLGDLTSGVWGRAAATFSEFI